MADPISRALFYEGQLLAAADLQTGVDHGPAQLARHERYLHLWGIAAGLTLDKTSRATAAPAATPYVEVTLKAGMAVDGTGREIVVPADTALNENAFAQANVDSGAEPDAWFPVLLVGIDEQVVPSAGTASACSTSMSNRALENFLIQFGHPGSAAILAERALPDVTQGAASGAWPVLLGYVQWNKKIGKFVDVGSSDQGISRRYAGVQADEVAARSGELVLRSVPRAQAGGAAITLGAATAGDSPDFCFGAQDAAGNVQPVFRVTAKGDVIASGKIAGAAVDGSVQVQSGTATDGVILPLPAGVTEDMIASHASFHVQLVPRLADPVAGSFGTAFATPFICSVDADRRVNCLVLVYAVPTLSVTIEPGTCDYLLIVPVSAQGGS